MDVTCERCGTEYEFDETLVSDRGTTVKCTNCGHLFKVFRRGAEASRGDESTKVWQLRMASGETQTFGSLKELQRLIAEGKVSEDDKLARSGEGWKRLGDIAELSTFFAAARPAKKAPAPPAAAVPKPPGKGTMMGMGGARREAAEYQPAATLQSAVPPPPAVAAPPRPKPAPPAPSPARPAPPPEPEPAPPPRRPAPRTDQTMKGIGSNGRQSYEEIGSSDAISEPALPPPRAHAPPPPRAVDSEPPPPPPRRRQEERRPDSRRPPPMRQLQLDDDEAPAPPRRNLTPVWLGLFVLALVGGGLFWAWPMIQGGQATTVAPASPADRFITAGESALARDRLAAYDDAADEFTKALAVDEASVRAQVGLARAHALQAQARLFEADDIEARAGEDAALRGEATALRRTAAEEAAEARTAAEAAVRAGTGGADAELVLADALRLVGERDLAQSRLGRAQVLAPAPSAEALRVQALLAAPPGPAGLASARDLAAQAVAADGELLRARLLLARASLAAGDGEAARREAEAVLARDGTHADALALRDRAMALIAAGGGATPVPPTTSAAVVPPTTTTPAVLPPTTSTPPVAPPATSEGAGGGGGSSAPQARDYSSLVREGEARLERGQTASARQSFEAALRARSGGAEALTGLGYVMLNEGNAQGAARQFSSAAANGNGDALIGLGDAYRRLGQREQALEAYRRYLQILPSGSHASVARRQVDLLGGGGGSGGGGSGSGGSGSGGSGSGGSGSGGSGSGGSGSGGSGGSEAGSGGTGGSESGSGGSGGGQLTTPPTVTDTPAIESEP